MKQQRKKLFIDSRLQGRLILLIVALEIVILTAAMYYLYYRFAVIIEHDLYAIHRISQADMLSAFAEEIGRVVFAMVILNAMMLFCSHYIWSRQIGSVVQVFRDNLNHIRSLQLVELEDAGKPAHELLALLNIWYSIERKRLAALKQGIVQINIKEHYPDSDLKIIRDQISRCLFLMDNRQTQ